MKENNPDRWFLEEFDQFLTALWSENISYIVRLCRVMGEIYFVIGVIEQSELLNEALLKVIKKFEIMTKVLRARFPQILFKSLSRDEAKLIFKSSKKYTGILIGYPSRAMSKDRKTEDLQAKYQFESVIRSLLYSNASITIVAQPIPRDIVIRGLIELRELASKIESRIRGTDGWSFTISLPMLYAYTNILNSQRVVGTAHTQNFSDTKSISHIKQTTHQTSKTMIHSITHGKNISRSSMWSSSIGTTKMHQVSLSQAVTHSKTTTTQHSYSVIQQYSQTMSHTISKQESLGTTLSHSTQISRGINIQRSVSFSSMLSRQAMIQSSQSFVVSKGESFGQSSQRMFSISRTTQNTFGSSHTTSQTTFQSSTTTAGKNIYNNLRTQSSFGSATMGSSSGWNIGGSFYIQGAYQSQNSESYTAGMSFTSYQGYVLTSSHSATSGSSTGSSSTILHTQSVGLTTTTSTSLGEQHIISQQISRGQTITQGSTFGQSFGRTIGTTAGQSEQFASSSGKSISQIASRGYSDSFSRTFGKSIGETFGRSVSIGVSQTRGYSETSGISESSSRSVGGSSGVIMVNLNTDGISYSGGISSAYGVNLGSSRSIGSAQGTTFAQGIVHGVTQSISGGLIPSLGFHHTREWKNVMLEGLAYYIRELEHRYEAMKNVGGWKVSIFISGNDENDVVSVGAALEGALRGSISSPRTVRFFIPETIGIREYLNKCAQICCNVDLNDPNGFALERKLLDTVLSTVELTATAHFPRVEIQGIKVAEDIPPVFLQTPPSFSEDPDLTIGRIVDVHIGEPSPVWLKIPSRRLLHILIAGKTGSGKTNSAFYLVLQLFKLGWDVVILDWKNTWRQLLYLLKPEERKRLRIYTLANPNVNPLKINLLRPPKGVCWSDWADVVSEIFAYSYIPHPRSRSVVREELDNLYLKAAKTGRMPSLKDLYECIERRISVTDARVAGRGEIESLNAIRSRLWEYANEHGKLYVFNDDVVKIEELFVEKSENRIIILESAGLYSNHKTFILSLIASAIYSYYITRTNKRKRPLIIIIEEANHLIPPENIIFEQLHIYESIWETMFRELREKNIYLMAIAQIPCALPRSIQMNTPFKILMNLGVGDTTAKTDVDVFLEAMGLDSRWDHRHVKRFTERMPVGWGMVRIPYWEKQWDAWPFLVQFPLILKSKYPSDDDVRSLAKK